MAGRPVGELGHCPTSLFRGSLLIIPAHSLLTSHAFVPVSKTNPYTSVYCNPASAYALRFRCGGAYAVSGAEEEDNITVKMSGKEKFYGLGRSATAGQKRNQQLEQWEKSATNKEPSYVASRRKNPRVRFGESVVFLAASQSGDVEEVERLLTEEGADVNSVNKDGLTALHQVEREREGRSL